MAYASFKFVSSETFKASDKKLSSRASQLLSVGRVELVLSFWTNVVAYFFHLIFVILAYFIVALTDMFVF